MLPNGIASLLTVLATVGCHAKVKRSDDVAPLETVVQQQAAAIQSLQTKLSALEQSFGDKYMALNARLSLMEQHDNKQVAFHAHFSGNWDTPINVGTHATLKFDAVVTNVGKGYNPDTGAFTAPYNGTYLFLLTAVSKDRYTELDIRASGGRLLAMTGGYWDMGESAGTHRDTSHGTVHLAGGEQVWVQHNSHGSTILQYWYTTFTGVLLQADLD